MTDVLLIEDNERDARLVRIALSEVTHDTIRLQVVPSMEEGLEAIAKGHVEIALLDLNIPGFNGMDTLHHFRDNAPQTPVIVLTGLADEEMGIEAVRHGAQDFLVKGQMFGALLGRAIRYAVERHRILQEHKA